MVGVGETVVGAGLLVAVADLGGQGERGGMLDPCLAQLSVGAVGLAKAVECLHFTGLVAGLAEKADGPLMVVGGLPVVALPLIDVAEVGQRVGFTVPVAYLAGQG